MNKTIFRIFISFVLLSSVISVILLCVNIICFAFIDKETDLTYTRNNEKTLEQVAENLEIIDNNVIFENTSIISDNSWCILINENGDVIWSHNKPIDVPTHYSLNDIAKMTRWFLNDYPIYVRTEDYGLLVLGNPKDAVGKYFIEYSMDWFDTLPKRIIIVLAINLIFSAMLASIFGIGLYTRLKMLTGGIKALKDEKPVNLKEKGIFKVLIKNINETSKVIAHKNNMLNQREKARSNWISGVSHDIRTPLTIIMGNSEAICKSEISEESKKRADIITIQCTKIKKLIANLNLISCLEYDMQPSKKREIRIGALLRTIVTDIINSGLDDKYEINLNIHNETAFIKGDEELIERALFNIINNSIVHNEMGCIININEYINGDKVYIKIKDNGKGVSEEVIKNIDYIPKTSHGIGLPMAKKIFIVHGGQMEIKNNNGFETLITLPIKD